MENNGNTGCKTNKPRHTVHVLHLSLPAEILFQHIHRLRIAAPHFIIGLVVNKTDRVAAGCRFKQWVVSSEGIALFSAHKDVAFAETSTKPGDNVRTIFEKLGRQLSNQPEQWGTDTALFLDPSYYDAGSLKPVQR
jgi:hypothetical protein